MDNRENDVDVGTENDDDIPVTKRGRKRKVVDAVGSAVKHAASVVVEALMPAKKIRGYDDRSTLQFLSVTY